MKIRCLVKADGDLYVAMSLEFGLAAQGETVEEAFDKLKGQIYEYVTEAHEQDIQHNQLLKKRKGPFSWFVLYYFAKFFDWLTPKKTVCHVNHYVSHA